MDVLKITSVQIRPWLGPQPSGRSVLIASATVEIGGWLVVERVRIVRLYDGRRLVAMPSVRNANGSFTDVVRPANREAREALNSAVLAAVDRAV